MTAISPWVERFDPMISDKTLRELIKIPAEPAINLSALPPAQARLTLEHALKKIMVPTNQITSVIRTLLAYARTYSEICYPNAQKFLERAYADKLPDSPLSPILLTGLAGVGKSQIISAFDRLFFKPVELTIPHHSKVPMVTSWAINIYGNIGIKQLLSPHFRAARGSIPKSEKSVIDQASHEATLQGLALLLADETQFQTQGTANTQIAKLLMQLSRIGPPLVFACNFSLVHRLLKRPQEERQRLFSHPIIVYPDSAESDDWLLHIQELFRVAAEFSALSSKNLAPILFQYTFGLKRSVVLLLCIAYSLMRQRNRSTISMRDIEDAYLSVEYATTKTDVECLISGSLKNDLLRLDLRNPLERRNYLSPVSEGIRTLPTSQQYAQRVSEAALQSTLSVDEGSAFHILVNQSKESSPERKKGRPPASVKSLIDGAEHFSKSKKYDGA